MKKVDIWVRLVCTGVILFFVVFDHEVRAQSVEGKWGIGIRGGGALPYEDVSTGFDSKTGPIVSGNILYGLGDIFSVGLNIEWEKHDIELSGRGVGEAKTTSIIPLIEWRPIVSGAVSYYLSFGLGINMNSFNRDERRRTILSEDLTAQEIAELFTTPFEVDPENTMAIKISSGFDYFAAKNLAVNTEVGWKSNSGNMEFCLSLGCETRDWDASVLSALLGFRYYF